MSSDLHANTVATAKLDVGQAALQKQMSTLELGQRDHGEKLDDLGSKLGDLSTKVGESSGKLDTLTGILATQLGVSNDEKKATGAHRREITSKIVLALLGVIAALQVYYLTR